MIGPKVKVFEKQAFNGAKEIDDKKGEKMRKASKTPLAHRPCGQLIRLEPTLSLHVEWLFAMVLLPEHVQIQTGGQIQSNSTQGKYLVVRNLQECLAAKKKGRGKPIALG